MKFRKKKNLNKGKETTENFKEPVLSLNQSTSNIIEQGYSTLKDVLAPNNIDKTNPSKLIVNDRHTRSFMVSGYPNTVSVGSFDALYNYDGNIDFASYIFPVENQDAVESLTSQITQFESQLQIEERKGEIRNVTRYRDMINSLIEKRRNIEKGMEKIFQVQMLGTIQADNTENLDKEMQMLDSRLRGQQISLDKLYFQQDEGFQSVLPFGMTSIGKFRNFSSGALTACFPFYNAEVIHETGIICGRNMITGLPISIDFYDRSKLANSNCVVIGMTGAGKTYLVSLITIRSVLEGIRTAILDPEGDYDRLTRTLGGKVIDLSNSKQFRINFFDIEEEEIIDENTGKGTGNYIVNLKEKVSDLLNLIVVMIGDATTAQQSVLSEVLFETYRQKGITEDMFSLFTEIQFDSSTNKYYPSGKRKQMPVFSDFCNLLENYILKNGDTIGLTSCLKALEMYKKGQVYDLFDCQTSEELGDYMNSLVISFNISKIENNMLRPIGMYVIMTWIWEKFVKKNIKIKKRVIADEAWILVSKNIKGYQYSSTFLEQMARRVRKRNGGLMVASQNFSEFMESSQGRAVLRQSLVNILLSQVDSDKDALKEIFNLSEGEVQFLLTAKRGEALFKVNGDTTIVKIEATPLEHKVIDAKEENPFLTS